MIMAKQVKVQAVSELVINQMNAATYFEEKAAGRLKDSEVYVVEPEKQGASVESFYQWLKERNYDLTNFQGLEGVFPLKAFPEIKAANLAGGDTKIDGTGAPNTIVEYDGKRTQVGNDGHFMLEGISPLVDGDLIQITCYDYAGRKKTFSVAVGKIEYAVPEGTTEITSYIVRQYNLNRAGRLVFPPSVKSVDYSAFYKCASITSLFIPACTSVGSAAFYGCNNLQTVILSDGWTPSSNALIPTTATVYNPDKTKKVDWNTMSWVNV